MTIKTTGGAGLNLVSCKDSYFKDLNLESVYAFGFTPNSDITGIKMSSLSSLKD